MPLALGATAAVTFAPSPLACRFAAPRRPHDQKSNLTAISVLRTVRGVQGQLRIPVQTRSLRTRAQIVEAARDEFGERGYALTTTRSIAERARVATGTFYHYFPDKDAVLREITAERVDALEQRISANRLSEQLQTGEALRELRGRIRADVRAYLDYHRRDRGLHAVITERRLVDAELDAIMSTAERRGMRKTADALRRWGFAGDPQATALMIFSLLDGAVHNQVLSHGPAGPVNESVSDARFMDALVEAILRIGASPAMMRAIQRDK